MSDPKIKYTHVKDINIGGDKPQQPPLPQMEVIEMPPQATPAVTPPAIAQAASAPPPAAIPALPIQPTPPIPIPAAPKQPRRPRAPKKAAGPSPAVEPVVLKAARSPNRVRPRDLPNVQPVKVEEDKVDNISPPVVQRPNSLRESAVFDFEDSYDEEPPQRPQPQMPAAPARRAQSWSLFQGRPIAQKPLAEKVKDLSHPRANAAATGLGFGLLGFSLWK